MLSHAGALSLVNHYVLIADTLPPSDEVHLNAGYMQ